MAKNVVSVSNNSTKQWQKELIYERIYQAEETK